MLDAQTAPPATGGGDSLRLSGALALLVGWWPVAVGEALYGSLDSLALEPIAANASRFATAAVLELVGAVILIPAVLTLFHLGRRTAPVLTWIGGSLSIVLSIGLGGFVQLHLLALELSASNLDRDAMSAFVEQNLSGFGLWSIPTLIVLVGMTFGLPVLVAGVRRARRISWIPLLIVVAGAVAHIGIETPWGEVVGHIGIAVGLSLIGVSVLRMPRDSWSPPAVSTVP